MSIGLTVLTRRLQRAGAVFLVLATANCSQLPTTASIAIPPIPPGAARVWFYRDVGSYDSSATPYVRMNEAIVAISQPQGASYRDVAPGPPATGQRVDFDRARPSPAVECCGGMLHQ